MRRHLDKAMTDVQGLGYNAISKRGSGDSNNPMNASKDLVSPALIAPFRAAIGSSLPIRAGSVYRSVSTWRFPYHSVCSEGLLLILLAKSRAF
jgi:hypothetical protein